MSAAANVEPVPAPSEDGGLLRSATATLDDIGGGPAFETPRRDGCSERHREAIEDFGAAWVDAASVEAERLAAESAAEDVRVVEQQRALRLSYVHAALRDARAAAKDGVRLGIEVCGDREDCFAARDLLGGRVEEHPGCTTWSAPEGLAVRIYAFTRSAS